MAHNACCDSYHVYNVTYIYYTIVPILGGQVCDVCQRAISRDRCSLTGFLVVMSVVVVLVLLFLVSRWMGRGGSVHCPLVLCSLLLL